MKHTLTSLMLLLSSFAYAQQIQTYCVAHATKLDTIAQGSWGMSFEPIEGLTTTSAYQSTTAETPWLPNANTRFEHVGKTHIYKCEDKQTTLLGLSEMTANYTVSPMVITDTYNYRIADSIQGENCKLYYERTVQFMGTGILTVNQTAHTKLICVQTTERLSEKHQFSKTRNTLSFYTKNNQLPLAEFITDTLRQGEDMRVISFSLYTDKQNTATPQTTKPKLEIYPNPTTGKITIQGLDQEPTELTIYDITGKACYYRHDLQSDQTIDLSQLADGMYVVELKTETTCCSTKIIKNKH